MYIFVADSIDGPFRPDTEGYPLLVSNSPPGIRPQWNEEQRQMENEFFWKAIIGEMDIDAEWDAYVRSGARWAATS